MAKKKKQKKAGIEKRRKNKQQRKTATKRRELAKQPVQKKISPAKLKQNLKNIPSLIFEPELEELAFSPDQIKEAQSQQEKVPEQIGFLASPEFTEKLKTQLDSMKERFEQQGDTNKTMMAHAIIYFMEQENAPPFLNQIVVAMYFNALHQIENDEPLTLKELNGQLREYDKEWSEYLQEKAEVLSSLESAEQVEGEDDASEAALEPSIFESVVEEFVNYLETEQSLEDEQRERMQEDVEVFVNDYFEDKGITELDSLRSRKVKTFLESWFITNMHPTKEDLETMIDSLDSFFNFTVQKEKISPEKGKEILELLQDKETFLSNLNI